MSSPRFSRQPQQLPPEIYRRRRLAGLAVLAVVVWLLTTVISGIGNMLGGGNAKPAASQSATSAPATTACAPGSIEVTAHVGTAASVDQLTFAANEVPYVWFTLKNTTTTACKFDYIAAASNFTVTSGAETIWTNKDCAAYTQGTDAVVDLAPAQILPANPAAWERVRSSQATGCAKAGNAPAVAGSYHLIATVSNVHSADLQFVLN
ncbi:MAG: hypothetical protein RL672_1401 [Actinomycetota bacterium]|jgi:hypothetical protein